MNTPSQSPVQTSLTRDFAEQHMHTILARLAGAGAVPRADQVDAVHAVLQPASRVLVVQATGWGKSAVYWAARAIDVGSDDASLALHAAKSFAADTAFKCAADMIQLHGGIGFTWEHDAHLFFKRARSLQTLMGSGAWHREQVARIVLGDMA